MNPLLACIFAIYIQHSVIDGVTQLVGVPIEFKFQNYDDDCGHNIYMDRFYFGILINSFI